MWRGALVVAAWCLGLGVSGAAASTLSLEDRASVGKTIRLTGVIEEGDSRKFRNMLAEAGSPANPVTVEFSSLGGSFPEGIKIGTLIHEHRAATLVRKGDRCLSACAVAFLGGASRTNLASLTPSRTLEVGGQVGFHAVSLNFRQIPRSPTDTYDKGLLDGFALAREVEVSLIAYLGRIGIDPHFMNQMLVQQRDQFNFVDSADRFISLGICPRGIDRPAVPADQQAINLSRNLTARSQAASSSPPQAVPLPDDQVRRHLLEAMQARMASSGVKGALSAQLTSYDVMRNKRAIELLYDDLRAVGLPLPVIVGPTFEITGDPAAPEDLRIVVSLSLEDPDKFSLVTLGPTGLSPPARLPPSNCPRLSLFDRQYMLNP